MFSRGGEAGQIVFNDGEEVADGDHVTHVSENREEWEMLSEVSYQHW